MQSLYYHYFGMFCLFKYFTAPQYVCYADNRAMISFLFTRSLHMRVCLVFNSLFMIAPARISQLCYRLYYALVSIVMKLPNNLYLRSYPNMTVLERAHTGLWYHMHTHTHVNTHTQCTAVKLCVLSEC